MYVYHPRMNSFYLSSSSPSICTSNMQCNLNHLNFDYLSFDYLDTLPWLMHTCVR